MKIKYRILEITNGNGSTYYKADRCTWWRWVPIYAGPVFYMNSCYIFKDKWSVLKRIEWDIEQIREEQLNRVVKVKYEYIVKTV